MKPATALLMLATACDTTDQPADTGDTGGTGGTGTAAALEEGWQHDLTFQGGCSDATMYARNEDDTLALYFHVNGVAQATWDAGGEAGWSWPLPDAEVTLEVWQGEHVTHELCNDALEYEPVIETRWTATGGYAALWVTSTGEPNDWGEYPAQAVLTLQGVTFEANGDSVEAAGATVTADIGWLPG